LFFRWASVQIVRRSLALIWGKDQQRAVGRRMPQPVGSTGREPEGQPPLIDPDELFAAAVRASADMEMDWMWLYVQMTGCFERLYCLEKAIALDPQNQAARRELERLVSGR
jgi:hypothetical protein